MLGYGTMAIPTAKPVPTLTSESHVDRSRSPLLPIDVERHNRKIGIVCTRNHVSERCDEIFPRVRTFAWLLADQRCFLPLIR